MNQVKVMKLYCRVYQNHLGLLGDSFMVDVPDSNEKVMIVNVTETQNVSVMDKDIVNDIDIVITSNPHECHAALSNKENVIITMPGLPKRAQLADLNFTTCNKHYDGFISLPTLVSDGRSRMTTTAVEKFVLDNAEKLIKGVVVKCLYSANGDDQIWIRPKNKEITVSRFSKDISSFITVSYENSTDYIQVSSAACPDTNAVEKNPFVLHGNPDDANVLVTNDFYTYFRENYEIHSSMNGGNISLRDLESLRESFLLQPYVPNIVREIRVFRGIDKLFYQERPLRENDFTHNLKRSPDYDVYVVDKELSTTPSSKLIFDLVTPGTAVDLFFTDDKENNFGIFEYSMGYSIACGGTAVKNMFMEIISKAVQSRLMQCSPQSA